MRGAFKISEIARQSIEGWSVVVDP